MSERGVFAVDRGIWDHPIFADEPLTEREAWQWLISEASFRSRKKRIGSTVFDLERGQLACSLRFMGEAWQWKKDAVARFLNKLRSETMIETQARHDATIITVCNYDRYQKVSLPAAEQNETHGETPTRHQRDKLEDNKNTKLDADAVPRGALVSPEAMVLSEKLLVIAGHDPKFWPPGWCGAPMRVQTWLSQGWPPEIIVAAVKGAAARKRGSPANSVQFFENAVAEEVARQSAPLPNVEIREAEKVVAYGTQKTESLSHVARRHAEQGISFGERPSATGLRIVTGGSDVRLLPKSGGE